MEEGDLAINEKGSTLWKTIKTSPVVLHTLSEYHVEKINRTGQSIKVKPYDYCRTRLPKFYCITIFISKISIASRVTWRPNIRVLRCLLWIQTSAWSEQFPFEIPRASRCFVQQRFMGGRPGEKEVDRKPVFPQTVLENQYSLLTHFYFIGMTKGKKINYLLLKNFWPDFGEGHEEEEVDKVCERPLGMGLGCYPTCDKMK